MRRLDRHCPALAKRLQVLLACWEASWALGASHFHMQIRRLKQVQLGETMPSSHPFDFCFFKLKDFLSSLDVHSQIMAILFSFSFKFFLFQNYLFALTSSIQPLFLPGDPKRERQILVKVPWSPGRIAEGHNLWSSNCSSAISLAANHEQSDRRCSLSCVSSGHCPHEHLVW